MEPKATFASRLRYALDVRGMTQKELADRTGIGKPRINHYIKGRYEAKQDGIYKIAKVLDVNEAWLMGYDCPMEREEACNAGITRLCLLYEEMTEEGRTLLLAMAESLHSNHQAPPVISEKAAGT